MQSLAFFTDIYANIEALEAILYDIDLEDIHDIYHLGDAIAIGPNPKETLDKLIEHKVNLIKGNHENYYLNLTDKNIETMGKGEYEHQKWTHKQLGERYRSFIESIPYDISLQVEGISLYLCHYPFEEDTERFLRYKKFEKDITVSNISNLFKGKEYNLYLYGHWHDSSDIISENDGRRYINVGSAGATHDHFAQYTIVDIEGDNYTVRHKKVIYNKDIIVKTMRVKQVPEGEFIIKNFYGLD